MPHSPMLDVTIWNTANTPQATSGRSVSHIQGWLERVDDIVERGKDAHLADAVRHRPSIGVPAAAQR